MQETLPTNYQSIPDMTQTERTVPGKKLFVHLAGKTNNAHQELVESLKNAGQTEVSILEDSDYVLVFCPIASRVGTDISEALENMPGGKKAILVVMHHTFSPNHVVAPSNRQVTNPNVLLTVDCLFYEGKLLQSDRNETALNEIMKFLGVSHSPCRSAPGQVVETGGDDGEGGGEAGRETEGNGRETGGDRGETGASQRSSGTTCINKMPGKKLFVHLAGKTNNAHGELVESLERAGQTEVSILEDSDYVLVFCPITSRVGTDISEALENMPGGKKAILVVMHHTFNPDHVVAPSNRQVTNPNVLLTVDCLFYESKLLQSARNEIALTEITKSLGGSHSPRENPRALVGVQRSFWPNWLPNWWPF